MNDYKCGVRSAKCGSSLLLILILLSTLTLQAAPADVNFTNLPTSGVVASNDQTLIIDYHTVPGTAVSKKGTFYSSWLGFLNWLGYAPERTNAALNATNALNTQLRAYADAQTLSATNTLNTSVRAYADAETVAATNTFKTYVDQAASNRVVVVAGANITVTPSGAGGISSYTVAGNAGGAGGAATNAVVGVQLNGSPLLASGATNIGFTATTSGSVTGGVVNGTVTIGVPTVPAANPTLSSNAAALSLNSVVIGQGNNGLATASPLTVRGLLSVPWTANNLSDLASPATARANIGANDAANLTAGTVALGRLSGITSNQMDAGSVAAFLAAGGGGGTNGEANLGSSLGTGLPVFKQKNGVTLEFRGVVASQPFDVTTNATDMLLAGPRITTNTVALTLNLPVLGQGGNGLATSLTPAYRTAIGAMSTSSNLSDVASAATARANLGAAAAANSVSNNGVALAAGLPLIGGGSGMAASTNLSGFRSLIDVSQIYTNSLVVYVKTNGNDSTARIGRDDLPYAGIRAAILAMPTGYTLDVGPGTYNEGADGNSIRTIAGTSFKFDPGAVLIYTNTAGGSATHAHWRPASHQRYNRLPLTVTGHTVTDVGLGLGTQDTISDSSSEDNITIDDCIINNLELDSVGTGIHFENGLATNTIRITFNNPKVIADRSAVVMRGTVTADVTIVNPDFTVTNRTAIVPGNTKPFAVIDIEDAASTSWGRMTVIGGKLTYSDTELSLSNRPAYGVWKNLAATGGIPGSTNNLVLSGVEFNPVGVTNALSLEAYSTNAASGILSGCFRADGQSLNVTNFSFANGRVSTLKADYLDYTNKIASPITVTVLGSTNTSTDTTSFICNVTTPATNGLIIVAVGSRLASNPFAGTVSGCNETFVQIATTNWLTPGTPVAQMTLYRAMTNTPSAGPITVAFSTTNQTAVHIVVMQCTGTDTSGASGAGAIVQSAINALSSSTKELTVTLNALSGDGDNTVLAAFGGNVNSATAFLTPEAGWFEDYQAGQSVDAIDLQVIHASLTADNTVYSTNTSSAHMAGIAVEIRAATNATPGFKNILVNRATLEGITTGVKTNGATSFTLDSGTGNISGGTFTGNGSGLTNLNASELRSGTVPNARLPFKTNVIYMVTLDEGGSVISTGAKKGFPVAGDSWTISGWSITAMGASPTCTIDVWKVANGTALPTVSNTIMGTKPALSTGNVVESSTLTSWTTSVTKGDIWGLNVDACANATNIVFQIFGYR